MRWKSLPHWLAVSLLLNGLLGLWILSDRVQSDPPATLSMLSWDPHKSLDPWSPALPDISSSLSPQTQTTLDHRHSLSYEGWVSLLSQEAAAVAANPPSNLCILAGDSISLWFPLDLLPPNLAWLNQGISGETTQGLRRRIHAFDPLEPRNIFIMIGINDLLHGTSPQEVVREQRRLVRQLKQSHPHSQIVLQSILPHSGEEATWEGRDRLLAIPNPRIADLNADLKALATEQHIDYLDLWPLFVDTSGNLRPHLTTDGLHLNGNGYLVWSTALQLFIEWQGIQPPPTDFNPNVAQDPDALLKDRSKTAKTIFGFPL